MGNKGIYVVGYPKSGSTFLSRLLGDALNSPVQADPTRSDKHAIADEGVDRPGEYVIMQHHLRFPPRDGNAIVYIHRDPRDVLVSAMFYWKFKDLDDILSHTSRRPKPLDPQVGWSKHLGLWLREHKNHVTYVTNYENLIDIPYAELRYILQACTQHFGTQTPSSEAIHGAVERQSFATRRKEIANADPNKYPYGRDLQLHNMRKGVVGDWKNYFKRRHGKKVHEYWWLWMSELGYETNHDWWKELPE